MFVPERFFEKLPMSLKSKVNCSLSFQVDRIAIMVKAAQISITRFLFHVVPRRKNIFSTASRLLVHIYPTEKHSKDIGTHHANSSISAIGVAFVRNISL